ncbi:hypothetical protein HY491_04775 [Candidatus Woesearchaeota archaeon]|nr:hypothetical protein [Candidatus Woesearchaeota archaeon]
MTNRGVLFTAGMVILGAVTLALVLVVVEQRQQANAQLIPMLGLDRQYDLFTSIEGGLREIILVESGMEFNASNATTVMIGESIPSNADAFRAAMAGFEDFVEDNFAEVQLNLIDVNDNLPFFISPYNVSFTHPDQYGQDRITITPTALNVKSYGIFINSSKMEIESLTWGGSKSGNVPMSVRAVDYLGNEFVEAHQVDLTKNVAITIAFADEDDDLLVQVRPNELGTLRVENHEEESVFVAVTIGFPLMSEPVSVTLPPDTIRINYSSMGIEHRGTVRMV